MNKIATNQRKTWSAPTITCVQSADAAQATKLLLPTEDIIFLGPAS
jgi:hypothetical protein